MNSTKVPSVNYHIWEPCNMRCRFCFAIFQDVKQEMRLPKGHLPEQDCITIVDKLAQAGFKKINFAGGEPTLCKWLPDLIEQAKRHGMVTSIVSNGSRITTEWLDGLNGGLDWIALSIDTVDSERLKRVGRTVRAKPITEEEYLKKIDAIKQRGIRLKINTVVTSETWQEDFTNFIRLAKPERWKMLQVLPVKGQNDEHIADLEITKEQFEAYVQRNRIVENDEIIVIPENNELMTASYIMVDPAGRFFDNERGGHTYSRSILEVGVGEALEDIAIKTERFIERGGQYNW